MKDKFWESKQLNEMSEQEWEALCDGCGRCCLHKLIDDETEEVYYTNVACRYLDVMQCRCKDYPNRFKIEKECIVISPENVQELNWLPKSCAYRRLARGEKLAWWHPLISGTPETVHLAGVSVRGKVVSIEDVNEEDLEDMVVDWFDGN